MQKAIDINCDLGEMTDDESIRRDREIMQFISSCNISCGLHAGDDRSINMAIDAAMERGVRIGAHPSFDDRANFGRKNRDLSTAELQQLIERQLSSFSESCAKLGAKLHHVKAHGALYNQLAVDRVLADAYCECIAHFDPSLKVYGLAQSIMQHACEKYQLTFIAEAFADRRYEANGQLRSRALEGAIIHDSKQLIGQLEDIVLNQKVHAYDGSWIPLYAQSICIHSDTEGSLVLAEKIYNTLKACHVRIGLD